MDNVKKEEMKNVKIRQSMHSVVKRISDETGINISKVVEMGVLEIERRYESGEFDNLIATQKQLRRDGSYARS
jgi:hypothetical protein